VAVVEQETHHLHKLKVEMVDRAEAAQERAHLMLVVQVMLAVTVQSKDTQVETLTALLHIMDQVVVVVQAQLDLAELALQAAQVEQEQQTLIAVQQLFMLEAAEETVFPMLELLVLAELVGVETQLHHHCRQQQAQQIVAAAEAAEEILVA
jgi:hypothetical protein